MVILLYAHPVRAIRHPCYAAMLLLALLGSIQSHNKQVLQKKYFQVLNKFQINPILSSS